MDKEQGDGEWREGLPPGKYYPGIEKDFEVYFSPGGYVWHRRKKEETEDAPADH